MKSKTPKNRYRFYLVENLQEKYQRYQPPLVWTVATANRTNFFLYDRGSIFPYSMPFDIDIYLSFHFDTLFFAHFPKEKTEHGTTASIAQMIFSCCHLIHAYTLIYVLDCFIWNNPNETHRLFLIFFTCSLLVFFLFLFLFLFLSCVCVFFKNIFPCCAPWEQWISTFGCSFFLAFLWKNLCNLWNSNIRLNAFLFSLSIQLLMGWNSFHFFQFMMNSNKHEMYAFLFPLTSSLFSIIVSLGLLSVSFSNFGFSLVCIA